MALAVSVSNFLDVVEKPLALFGAPVIIALVDGDDKFIVHPVERHVNLFDLATYSGLLVAV